LFVVCFKAPIWGFFYGSILRKGKNLFVNSPTMKFIIVLFFSGLCFLSSAHESYFSFAEMEYNPTCECLEVTLTVSSHDLESFAIEKKIIDSQLESGLIEESLRMKMIDEIIFEGFKVYDNKKEITLFYVGHELFQDGNCSIYLKSESFDKTTVQLFYGLFMNVHTEQQNKLSYKQVNKQTVYNFFVFKRENEIEL